MKTRFDYKHSFILDNYTDNRLIKEELTTLKNSHKLQYFKDYKEKLFDFSNFGKKLEIKYRYDNTFTFVEYANDGHLIEDNMSLFEFFVVKIVKPRINNYLNRSIFMDSFYDEYVKPYISKMAKTIKNYTIESTSYSSVIPPFETGWIKFCSSNNFEETIDEMTLDILYKLTKVKINVILDDISRKHKVYSLYDILMKSDMIVSKLNKSFVGINYSNESFNSVKKYFHEISTAYMYLDYDRYIDDDGKRAIEFVKKIVRFLFVELIKQMIPSYFMSKRYHDADINSLIGDIELYYTKNLSNLRSNDIYYESQKDFCERIIETYDSNEKIDPDVLRTHRRDLKYILISISQHISDEHAEAYKQITSSLNLEAENIEGTKANVKKAYNDTLSIITDLYNKSERALHNSYNFSFIKRWNEIIDEHTIWCSEDYINNKINFINGGN